MSQEVECLTDVVTEIEHLGETRTRVCLGDALDRFGERSFAPVLIVVPLIELTPVGGIPGVPTVLAGLLALIAVQMLLGREHVWLPRSIMRRAMKGDTLANTAHKLDSVAEWIDEHVGSRLDWLLGGWGQRLAAVGVLLLCLTVPPLEFVPFASSIPMIAIAILGLSLLVRDGVLMLIAMAIGGAAIGFAGYALIFLANAAT